MTATESPSDVALSIALEKLDQIGMMTKRGRASVSARATAAFIRTQLESATTETPEIGSKSVVPTAEQMSEWQPIETAPTKGRTMILLLTPSRFPQVAWSNTWWTAGSSVECKPTHWLAIPELPMPPNP